MTPREVAPPQANLEHQLRQELQRAYEQLTDITSRLLLANEAAEAALSTHDRGELAERLLQVCARGCEVTRAALFLADPDGFAVGATRGLAPEEEEALPSSQADVDACSTALEENRLLVLDPELVAEDVDTEAGEERDEPGDGDGPPAEEEEGDEAEGKPEDEDQTLLEDESELGEKSQEPESATRPARTDQRQGDAACMFGIYLPVRLEGDPIAVLALAQRSRGRPYGNEEIVFLRHVMRQFAPALNRSVLIEQNEQRLRELDALLRVSREITSTLDLDVVLRAVVNTVSAVVPNDRAEIALLKGGRLLLRAVSGRTRLDPDQTERFHLQRPFEYLRLNPVRLQISADDVANDPKLPGSAVFREYFENQDMRSFMALPLKDEQGQLGILCLESKQDEWDVQPAEGDALDIVAAQTTVAIRNAQLYSEIPLKGMSRPMARVRTRWRGMARRKRNIVAAVLAVLVTGLLLPIFPERAGGPATIMPIRYQGVCAMSEGVIGRVYIRGGEEVRAGQPLARLEDLDLGARLAQLRSEVELTRGQVAAARDRGDAVSGRAAQIHLAALERTVAFEERRARGTTLAAPFAGQVLELGLPQRMGQHLSAGESFCTVAALDTVAAEIELSEDKIGRVRGDEAVALKAQAFPGRTFRGRVTEVGWRGEPGARGVSHFRVRATIDNSRRVLRPGMSGIAKASIGRRSMALLAFDPVIRALRMNWW